MFHVSNPAISVQSILVLLKGEDTESQLDGLHQLNDLLSVAMEDTLSMSPIDQLVPLLVRVSLHSPIIPFISEFRIIGFSA